MAGGTLLKTSFLLSAVAFCISNGQHNKDITDCKDPVRPSWINVVPHNSSTFKLYWINEEYSTICIAGYRVCLHQPTGEYACQFVSFSSLSECSSGRGPCTWSSDGSLLLTEACAKFTATVATVYDILGVDGRISESKSITFQAAPDGVTGLSAVETTGNYSRLEWEVSQSACTDHRTVSWCSVDTSWSSNCSSSTTQKQLSEDENTFTITGLRPCSLYRVTLATVSGRNGPQTEDVLYVTTPSTGIGAVQNLTTSVVGNKVALVWDYLPEDRRCTASYDICWREENTNNSRCTRDMRGAELSLNYCTNYTISVQAVDVSNTSSEPLSITVRTGAEKVKNVTATDVGARSATLNWEPSPSAGTCGTGYLVSWWAVSDQDTEWSSTSNFPINVTQGSISGLRPCLRHHFTIVTISDDSTQSEDRSVVVHTLLDDLGAPQNLLVNVVSSAVTMVYFSPPEDSGTCISKYTGCFWEDGDQEASTVCLPAPNDKYWVNWDNHTKPCTNYSLKLTVFSTDNRENSTTVSFTSGASEAEDLNVVNIITNSTSVSAKLTWNTTSFNKCVQYQEVTWAPSDGTGKSHTNNVSTDTKELVLHDLDPCTMYSVDVVQQAPTPSIASTFIFTSATNATSVSDLDVACVPGTACTVDVSFFAPETPPSCSDHYSVCCGLRDAGNWTCYDVYGSGNLSIRVTSLNSSQEYGFSVTPDLVTLDHYFTSNVTFIPACSSSGCGPMLSVSISTLAVCLSVIHKLLVVLK